MFQESWKITYQVAFFVGWKLQLNKSFIPPRAINISLDTQDNLRKIYDINIMINIAHVV